MTTGNSAPGLNQAQTLALQLLQNGNPAAAEEVLRPLLVYGMKDELVPMLGMIRLQQERFPEAAQMFERARVLYPREARFAFLHGAALTGMGQVDKAVPAYQEAIKRDPNAVPAYLALGNAQRKLGQHAAAQATLRKLLRLAPDNAEALLALSSVLMEMGQPGEAETSLRKALLHAKDKKDLAALHNNLSVSLGSQNRNDEALESLERAQALAPELPNIDQRRIDLVVLGPLQVKLGISAHLRRLKHDHDKSLAPQLANDRLFVAATCLDADAFDAMPPKPIQQHLVTLRRIVDLQRLGTAVQRDIELPFAGIDPGADRGTFGHLRRPSLVCEPWVPSTIRAR